MTELATHCAGCGVELPRPGLACPEGCKVPTPALNAQQGNLNLGDAPERIGYTALIAEQNRLIIAGQSRYPDMIENGRIDRETAEHRVRCLQQTVAILTQMQYFREETPPAEPRTQKVDPF